MNAQDDNTAPSRTGMRRLIPRFEFRRLHAMARVHIVAGTVLVGLGVITLAGGSFTPKAIAWAAFFLVLAALQFSVGYWFLAIVRSAPPGPELVCSHWSAVLAGSCWHRELAFGGVRLLIFLGLRRRQDPRERSLGLGWCKPSRSDVLAGRPRPSGHELANREREDGCTTGHRRHPDARIG